jgi:hypothetical protein
MWEKAREVNNTIKKDLVSLRRRIITVLWNVTYVVWYISTSVSKESPATIFSVKEIFLEHGDVNFLRNTGTYIRNLKITQRISHIF